MSSPTRALLFTAALSAALLAAQTGPEKRAHRWWNDRPVGGQPYTVNARKMPLISVKGNKFVDPLGQTVLFRGVSISDPDKLEGQGHWSKDHLAKVKEMGAAIVRIPGIRWRGASGRRPNT
ncbi:MAG: hypothetical protein ABSF64_06345 [Bryobacteraceae bacterium]|jgi:hypothetical protein